ncbi:putative Tat pathway signal sequence [Echria macrotheca]|uniref:Tat pathway signal sequence n=1 Tax=Echria macrotheca TaxID=438768 RepID=A0AAJ0BL42_9PEZI|nr:putative Tat pathway signal sequence [Echria macrotheca]
MATIENEPLLENQYHNGEESSEKSSGEHRYQPQKPNRPSRRWWLYAGLVQLLLISCYTAGSYYVIRATIDTDSVPDIHAFAGLAVKYKFRLYDNFINSPYGGEPTAESDAAWHTLLNNMSVRVTAEELAAHGQTSVALPRGGYLAWLGVFHELHCVKMLRQWSWREHYFPNMTAHEHMHQMVHIDHCLDWLRNAAICRADTSALAVFKWDPRMPHPMLNTHRVPHRCVDWDALMDSHADRVVPHDEVANLENPLMRAANEAESADGKGKQQDQNGHGNGHGHEHRKNNPDVEVEVE